MGPGRVKAVPTGPERTSGGTSGIRGESRHGVEKSGQVSVAQAALNKYKVSYAVNINAFKQLCVANVTSAQSRPR